LLPGPVPGLARVAAIAAGGNFSVALNVDGTVWTWGQNNLGQLGVGPNSGPDSCAGAPCSMVPVRVPGLTNVVAVSAFGSHVLALRCDSGFTSVRAGCDSGVTSVWAWGANTNGQLGDGSTDMQVVPVQVRDSVGSGYVSNVIGIAAGGMHSLALMNDGTVQAWGDNSVGQIGDGVDPNVTTPVKVRFSESARR